MTFWSFFLALEPWILMVLLISFFFFKKDFFWFQFEGLGYNDKIDGKEKDFNFNQTVLVSGLKEIPSDVHDALVRKFQFLEPSKKFHVDFDLNVESDNNQRKKFLENLSSSCGGQLLPTKLSGSKERYHVFLLSCNSPYSPALEVLCSVIGNLPSDELQQKFAFPTNDSYCSEVIALCDQSQRAFAAYYSRLAKYREIGRNAIFGQSFIEKCLLFYFVMFLLSSYLGYIVCESISTISFLWNHSRGSFLELSVSWGLSVLKLHSVSLFCVAFCLLSLRVTGMYKNSHYLLALQLESKASDSDTASMVWFCFMLILSILTSFQGDPNPPNLLAIIMYLILILLLSTSLQYQVSMLVVNPVFSDIYHLLFASFSALLVPVLWSEDFYFRFLTFLVFYSITFLLSRWSSLFYSRCILFLSIALALLWDFWPWRSSQLDSPLGFRVTFFSVIFHLLFQANFVLMQYFAFSWVYHKIRVRRNMMEHLDDSSMFLIALNLLQQGFNLFGEGWNGCMNLRTVHWRQVVAWIEEHRWALFFLLFFCVSVIIPVLIAPSSFWTSASKGGLKSSALGYENAHKDGFKIGTLKNELYSDPYKVCAVNFGSLPAKMSFIERVIDKPPKRPLSSLCAAIIADASYFELLVNDSFTAYLKSTCGVTFLSAEHGISFWESESEDIIIAFRGTHDVGDLISDMVIYASQTAVQVVLQYLPFPIPHQVYLNYADISDLIVSFLAHSSVADPFEVYLKYHGVENPVQYKAEFLQNLSAQYSKCRVGSKKGNKIIPTGHSLGGGIAQSLAVELRALGFYTEAIAFDSPGLSYGQKLFQVSHEDLIGITTNINANKDLVSQVDPNQASVFSLRCPSGGLFGSTACHGISMIVCELSVYCNLHNETYHIPRFCENGFSKRISPAMLSSWNTWNIFFGVALVIMLLAISIFSATKKYSNRAQGGAQFGYMFLTSSMAWCSVVVLVVFLFFSFLC